MSAATARPVGRVCLVGAGPGDPELLTLKAARLIREADVIVNDRLVHPDVLALAKPRARIVYLGKEAGAPSAQQGEINALLIAQARLGRLVVRLKGGDPFVFGRGGEEALALEAAGVPYEVVPGVSSGLGAPASVGIPLTHRGLSRSVTFATGTLSDRHPNWAHLAKADTLVLFMAGAGAGEALSALVDAGRPASTPAAIIEAGTWSHERVVVGTVGCLALRARVAGIASPALIVVGEVVALRDQLATWAQRASSEAVASAPPADAADPAAVSRRLGFGGR